MILPGVVDRSEFASDYLPSLAAVTQFNVYAFMEKHLLALLLLVTVYN